jgi:hypothetical protein
LSTRDLRNSTEGEKNSRQEGRGRGFKSFSRGQRCAYVDKRALGDVGKTSELVKATQESKVLIKLKRVADVVRATQNFSLSNLILALATQERMLI